MAYTSINTGGSGGTGGTGLSQYLVEPAWDLAVGKNLQTIPNLRTFVDVKPQSPAMAGSSVSMTKIKWFAESSLATYMTALTEESDVTAVAAPGTDVVTLTPAEYGMVVSRTLKFANRSFAPIDPLIARQLADVMGRGINMLVANAADSGGDVRCVAGNYTGVIATDKAATVKTDVLTALDALSAVARMRAVGVPTIGDAYVGVIHPFVSLDFRTATGADGWLQVHAYSDPAGIYRGEIGQYGGARFVENPWVKITEDGATGAANFRNYFFGSGGLAEHVVEEPHVVIGPVVDALKRFRSIGWYGDLAFGVYEQNAVQVVISGSSGDTGAGSVQAQQ